MVSLTGRQAPRGRWSQFPQFEYGFRMHAAPGAASMRLSTARYSRKMGFQLCPTLRKIQAAGNARYGWPTLAETMKPSLLHFVFGKSQRAWNGYGTCSGLCPGSGSRASTGWLPDMSAFMESLGTWLDEAGYASS